MICDLVRCHERPVPMNQNRAIGQGEQFVVAHLLHSARPDALPLDTELPHAAVIRRDRRKCACHVMSGPDGAIAMELNSDTMTTLTRQFRHHDCNRMEKITEKNE